MIKNFFSEKIPIFLTFLYLITLFLNQAPHNIAIILFSIFGFYTILKNQNLSSTFVKENKAYISFLVSFLILFSAVNFYHFGLNKDFVYSLSRIRWTLYALILIPTAVIISKKIDFTHLKRVFYCYLLPFFVLLSILIFIDSFTRSVFSEPSTSSWIKSNINDVFGNRAAWTINPIPFSKLSFMATLIFGFFYLKSKQLLNKVLFFLLSFGMLSVTILSQTRASWLGLLLIIPIFLIYIPETRKVFLTLFILGFSFIAFKPNHFLVKRLYSFKHTKSQSNRYRIEHAKANLKLSLHNPILGVGYASNSKKDIISPYLSKFTADENFLYQHPHNQYLDIISGVGYPLFFLFLGLLIWPLILTFKFLKNSREKTLWCLILSYQIFMLITACFDRITSLEWSALIASWCLIWSLKEKSKRKTIQ